MECRQKCKRFFNEIEVMLQNAQKSAKKYASGADVR